MAYSLTVAFTEYHKFLPTQFVVIGKAINMSASFTC